MENQLEVIIKESGLEESKAIYMLEHFQEYFKIAAEWEVKAKTIKVTDESQAVDMAMARTGRLFLREKRIAIEKARKQLKEQALREGKAIDGIANVLKALIIPIEEYLDRQEKFIEIKKKQKEETDRIEIERKEEEERLENERLDRVAIERKDMAMLYRQFWTTDNYAFREMSQGNFDSIMVDLRESKKEYDKEQERIRLENERLQKEAQEKEEALRKEREETERKRKEAELKAKKEKEKHEKAIAEERAKAEAEKREQEKKLRKQQEEAERKQKEIEQKAQEEAKKKEELLRKERELVEKKRQEAEAKAKTEQERIKKDAEAKAEAERKEKERLAEILKNEVECPFCHKRFSIDKLK